MSYILDALKRAEQKTRRGKAPEPHAVEPAVGSPLWQVKMVSPARYTRFRPKEGEGDSIEQRSKTDLYSSGRPSLRPGTPGGSEEPHPQAGTRAYLGVRRGERRSDSASAASWKEASCKDNEGMRLKANRYRGVGIAAAVLALLLLIECVVIYEVRDRMSVVATKAARLTRQMSEMEALRAKREGERLDLKAQNDSLRQELEKVNADLARARDTAEKLKVRRQRLAARKRQPTVAEQKRSMALPLASAPPPPTSYRPSRIERPAGLDSGASLWDMADTTSVTTYSIR